MGLSPSLRANLPMLSAGSNKRPAQLVEMMGIDIHDANFWQVGFDELARLVKEAEKLTRKVKAM